MKQQIQLKRKTGMEVFMLKKTAYMTFLFLAFKSDEYEKMPTEKIVADLSKNVGVTQKTIKKAIDKLLEGKIITEGAGGYWVNPKYAIV
jgi:hypothetical protein